MPYAICVGNFPYAGGNPLLEISYLGRYQGLRQILDQLDLFNFSRRSQFKLASLLPVIQKEMSRRAVGMPKYEVSQVGILGIEMNKVNTTPAPQLRFN